MASSIIEIKEAFILKAKDEFYRKGFILYKKNTSFVKQEGSWKYVYQIDVTNKQSYFTIHLKLLVYNEDIGLIQEDIRNKNSADVSNQFLSKALQAKVKENNSLIADLTDWKEIDVNNFLHIWFESFKELDSIKDFDAQLNLSITLALKWFDLCKSWEYLINYNLQRGLEHSIETVFVILKYLNKNEEIDKLFLKIKEERVKKKLSMINIEKFYNGIKLVQNKVSIF